MRKYDFDIALPSRKTQDSTFYEKPDERYFTRN